MMPLKVPRKKLYKFHVSIAITNKGNFNKKKGLKYINKCGI